MIIGVDYLVAFTLAERIYRVMKLFLIIYHYDDRVKVTIRRAVICAKNEEEARNILIHQEEGISDTFVDIISISKIYLDKSKIILIQTE